MSPAYAGAGRRGAGRAAVAAADVEEDQLVDVPVRAALDRAHRVADDLVDLEQLAAHDQAVLEQQHGDEPRPHRHLLKRHADALSMGERSRARAENAARTESPASWLFSGWNWTPWMLPRSTATVTGRPPKRMVAATSDGSRHASA